MKSPAFGYVPSPTHSIGTHDLGAFPRLYRQGGSAYRILPADNSDLIVDVLSQGGQGSCVGHALSYAIRGGLVHPWLSSGQQGPCPPAVSRAWPYLLGRLETGDQAEDTGTSPFYALAGLYRSGWLPESAWPYDDTTLQPDMKRMPALTRIAADQRMVKGYARVTSAAGLRCADISQALYARYLVVLGLEVDQAFCDLGADEIWPGPTGEILGGHCLCAVGCDSQSLRVINSWGTDWADRGFGRVSWDVISAALDVWVISMAPAFTGTE